MEIKLNIKQHKNQLLAYSLLEMFMVMMIVSIIILSIPVVVKKVNKVTDANASHGRFECWIKDGKIHSYYIEKPAFGDAKEPVEHDFDLDKTNKSTYCTFTPPTNTNYIQISAVGAGGAGAKLTSKAADDDINDPIYGEYLNNGIADNDYENWPSWLKMLHDALCKDSTSSNCSDFQNASVINTKLILRRVKLRLANGGKAGKIESMLFPSIPENVKIIMRPGLGGSLKSGNATANGNNGEDTLVEFVYGSDSTTCFKEPERCDNTCCNIIRAQGGSGGSIKNAAGDDLSSVYTTLVTPLGEYASASNEHDISTAASYGMDKLDFIKGEKSNFEYSLDNNNKLSSNFKSKIAGLNLGNGGNGTNDKAMSSSNQIQFFYGLDDGPLINGTGFLTKDVLNTINMTDINYSYPCQLSTTIFGCNGICMGSCYCCTNNNWLTGDYAQNNATKGNDGGVVIVW